MVVQPWPGSSSCTPRRSAVHSTRTNTYDTTMNTPPKTKLTIDDVPKRPPPLSGRTAHAAMILALAVRNAMEDFHCKYLSDAQMKELNPVIRNAIATALYAIEHSDTNPQARSYVDGAARAIPTYWEPPKLLVDFSRGDFLRRVRQMFPDSERPDPAEVLETAEEMLNYDPWRAEHGLEQNGTPAREATANEADSRSGSKPDVTPDR